MMSWTERIPSIFPDSASTGRCLKFLFFIRSAAFRTLSLVVMLTVCLEKSHQMSEVFSGIRSIYSSTGAS